MPQLAIIADDLTGAADTGACFADAGYATVIPLLAGAYPEADVLVVSTESRDMPDRTAAGIVGATVSRLWSSHDASRPRWIYKKIDSALRGHPRDELLAAMEATGANRTIVAPALPSEGRTTVGGCQLVHGVPLELSSFGGPEAISQLSAIFAGFPGMPVELVDLQALHRRPDDVLRFLSVATPGIVVADAVTDDDLATLAHLVSQSRLHLLCGAAGFARQLAPTLPLMSLTGSPITARRSHNPILVVAGSLHKATSGQIALLARSGVPVVRLSQNQLDGPSSGLVTIVSEVATHLAARRHVVLTTDGLAPSSRGARSVAARLAEIATAPAVVSKTGGLVLTGGDVAAAVCSALGAAALRLGGEIYAGQPWGLLTGGTQPGLPVATKAGSFGRENALLACINHLEMLTSER